MIFSHKSHFEKKTAVTIQTRINKNDDQQINASFYYRRRLCFASHSSYLAIKHKPNNPEQKSTNGATAGRYWTLICSPTFHRRTTILQRPYNARTRCVCSPPYFTLSIPAGQPRHFSSDLEHLSTFCQIS